MGGPWRVRGYDPAAWRPPRPRAEATTHPGGTESPRDRLTAIVVGYIASVMTSLVIMVALLRSGW